MAFMQFKLPAAFVLSLILVAAAHAPKVHFELHKRGGRLSRHEPVNISLLSQIANAAEGRYARSHLQLSGNQVFREWISRDVGSALDKDLMEVTGMDGGW